VVLALLTFVPLAWKWQLGVRPTAIAMGTVALLSGLGVGVGAEAAGAPIVAALVVAWLVILVAGAFILVYRFYRDPERVAPERDDVVVSPADGEVVYVRESTAGLLPMATKNGRPYRLEELTKTRFRWEDAVVVGISLNFLDVHVNRAPVSGRITSQRRFPGRFGSLRRPEMIFENERATIVIDQGALEVAVVLIASRLVRRIITFLDIGDRVALGQRIGMIRFGSQVDLVIPASINLRLLVGPGDKVVAGETVVALVGPRAQQGATVAGLAHA